MKYLHENTRPSLLARYWVGLVCAGSYGFVLFAAWRWAQR